MKDWWLDELRHAGDEHLDPTYVTGYDRKAAVHPSADITALVGLGLDASSTLVDFGPGTGTFLLAAAALCRRVTGVDVSPAMIEALRSAVAGSGLSNIRVVQAGLLTYEHEDEPVDFVYTRNALHKLPDFWKAIALGRIASALRPGGILMLRDLIFDFYPAEADERIEAWLARANDEPSVGWTASELAEHVRGEYSTFSWLLEGMLERTDFEIIHRRFRRSMYGRYICRRL